MANDGKLNASAWAAKPPPKMIPPIPEDSTTRHHPGQLRVTELDEARRRSPERGEEGDRLDAHVELVDDLEKDQGQHERLRVVHEMGDRQQPERSIGVDVRGLGGGWGGRDHRLGGWGVLGDSSWLGGERRFGREPSLERRLRPKRRDRRNLDQIGLELRVAHGRPFSRIWTTRLGHSGAAPLFPDAERSAARARPSSRLALTDAPARLPTAGSPSAMCQLGRSTTVHPLRGVAGPDPSTPEARLGRCPESAPQIPARARSPAAGFASYPERRTSLGPSTRRSGRGARAAP